MAGKAERRRLVVQRNATGAGAGAQLRGARKDGWTKDVKRHFLAVLSTTANVRESARAVGMSGPSAYRLKKRDAGFRAAWGEALDEGYAELEMLLLRQALFGTERIERIREGGSKNGPVKMTKTVHSYPMAVALRMHLAHREEVLRHRTANERERPDDAAVIARVRKAMTDIRARLLAEDGRAQDRSDGARTEREGL